MRSSCQGSRLSASVVSQARDANDNGYDSRLSNTSNGSSHIL